MPISKVTVGSGTEETDIREALNEVIDAVNDAPAPPSGASGTITTATETVTVVDGIITEITPI